MIYLKMLRHSFVVFLLVLLVGCAMRSGTDIPGEQYSRLPDSKVESLIKRIYSESGSEFCWNDLKTGIKHNLDYLSHKDPSGIAVSYGSTKFTWGMLRQTNIDMLRILPELCNKPNLLKDKFVWFALEPRTFMTGYYEPWLEASSIPDQEYPYPLYSVPDDLKKADLGEFHHRWNGEQLLYRIVGDHIEPYFNREKIDFDNVLKGRGLEIAWVKDLIDVFILQIQGSGRLVFPDGSVKHVLYAGRNGLKYVSLGKVLIKRGLMPKEGMSMQKIREFLRAHPEKMQDLLSTNPSYVFFRLADEGPFGSMNRALTPMSSIAVDRKVVPLGSMALLTSNIPVVNGDKNKKIARLVMAQDTGGAIKGTRVDLFCGSSEYAEYLAGHLRSYAHLYLPISRSFFKKDCSE